MSPPLVGFPGACKLKVTKAERISKGEGEGEAPQLRPCCSCKLVNLREASEYGVQVRRGTEKQEEKEGEVLTSAVRLHQDPLSSCVCLNMHTLLSI